MVDIIMAGRAFDFSVQFANDCYNRLSRKIRSALANNNSDKGMPYSCLKSVKIGDFERLRDTGCPSHT